MPPSCMQYIDLDTRAGCQTLLWTETEIMPVSNDLANNLIQICDIDLGDWWKLW